MSSSDSHVRIRPLTMFAVATALTFFSASQAFYFVATFGEKPASFAVLFMLNLGYWYSWACLAPGILWLSRRLPLDRQRWKVSLPAHVAGVFAATTLHIAMAVATRLATYWAIGENTGSWRMEAQRMFFLNFDWEMMTYWAIVGLSHALAYHREAQTRTLKASQLATRLVEAQLQSLQRQLQPHFLFNTLNTISALMHRDVEAADAMIARLSDLLRISRWCFQRSSSARAPRGSSCLAAFCAANCCRSAGDLMGPRRAGAIEPGTGVRRAATVGYSFPGVRLTPRAHTTWEDPGMSNPILATLRLIGMLAVVLLGALTILVVLDIVPRELLQTGAVKLLLVLAIIAAVALVVALLARKGPGG